MVKEKKNTNKVRKIDISEDCCFVCKDGGEIRNCDYRDCLKVYHPNCVRKDESFLKSGDDWICVYHFCSRCGKTSKFGCFFCPTAVCGSCLSDAEFAVTKGEKGFCRHCSKLAFLIEENADVDSDGEKIDFKAPETYECYFSDYYEIIKKKEGLNSLHVRSAHDSIKNGKNNNDSDPFEIGPKSPLRKVRQDDHIHKAALFKESNSDCQTLNAAKCGFTQPSNTESSSADPIATTVNDVIVLSDSDEEDANIADTSVGRKEVEDPDISIWHCSGPYGERGGPYSMSTLKLWNDGALFSLEKYKVWKTGQNVYLFLLHLGNFSRSRKIISI